MTISTIVMNRSVLVLLLVAVVVLCTCEARRICPGGPNDRFTKCGSACESSCSRPGPRICTLQCILNICQCEEGFVRREWDNRCVAVQECY